MGVGSSEMSTANASRGSGAVSTDGVDAPVDAGRVMAALERLRALLGPDAVPDLERADGTDDASLAESVDVALMGLGAAAATRLSSNGATAAASGMEILVVVEQSD